MKETHEEQQKRLIAFKNELADLLEKHSVCLELNHEALDYSGGYSVLCVDFKTSSGDELCRTYGYKDITPETLRSLT